MEPAVTKEVAIKDIEKWLDKVGVAESEREENKTFIEKITNAIEDGRVFIEDDFLKQILKFPIKDKDGNPVTKDLKYKTSLSLEEVHPKLQLVKATDAHGSMLAYVSALTGVSSGMLKKMNSQDYKISQAIAVFFA